MTKIENINDLLNYKITINLEQARDGYWNGGKKSHFEFTPSIERSPGVPAIRWGSYEANLWVVVPFKTKRQHFAVLRRKLRTSTPSSFTVHPPAECPMPVNFEII